MAVPPRISLIPAPPRPPDQYSLAYGNQLNRWLANLLEQVGGLSYLRGSGLFLSVESLPTSGYGLKPGEVFANDGILTIVGEDDIFAGSLVAEAEIGSLTVTV